MLWRRAGQESATHDNGFSGCLWLSGWLPRSALQDLVSKANVRKPGPDAITDRKSGHDLTRMTPRPRRATAWTDVANQPGVSERSASQAAGAQEAKYRHYETDKPTTRPGTQRSPGARQAAVWRSRHPGSDHVRCS
jgi:hypothetical protein